jgi:hypothetical protein
MLRLTASLLSASLILMGCHEQVPAGTGIRGVVTLGPTCPVETPTSPCPDTPFRGDVMATASDGTTTTVTTDARGRFTMDLREGTYVVIAVTPNGSGPPTPVPQTVQVEAGAYARITLEVDTGIR